MRLRFTLLALFACLLCVVPATWSQTVPTAAGPVTLKQALRQQELEFSRQKAGLMRQLKIDQREETLARKSQLQQALKGTRDRQQQQALRAQYSSDELAIRAKYAQKQRQGIAELVADLEYNKEQVKRAYGVP